ncbi:hypothetical protein KSS87_021247, partial [Heliosperma pusillum]
MGDVYGAIQLALQILTPLIDEVSLISNLKNDVNFISTELQSISVFLKNAEQRTEGDDSAKEWTRQLRMLAYEIEDVVDRYQLYTKTTTVSKAAQFLSFEHHSMASAIKNLRERTTHLVQARKNFTFGDRVNEDPEQSRGKGQNRLTTSYHQSTDYIDVDTVVNDVATGEIVELLDLQEEKMKTSTIVVIGMRGLGKTTVVDSVYHDKTVKSHFPLCAWIRAQERKSNIDILRSLILQFDEEVPN